MLKTRVIPCLLLKGAGFVKTIKFKNPTYLGDPVNILKIFNEKEVDEIFVLDISATPAAREPNFKLLEDLASECFMPLGYGGGITQVDQIKRLFQMGYEKISLNTVAFERPEFITQAANLFGSQSIVISLDVRKTWRGKHEIAIRCGMKNTGTDPVAFARQAEQLGAGELLVNSVDQDGTQQGYDLDLIKRVCSAVSIPVVACGGAGSIQHLAQGVNAGGASACAAGSMFVFQGPHRAVLITVPSRQELEKAFAGSPSA